MATLIQTLQNVLSQKDAFLAAETKRIVLKEALQAYVLDFLYNHSAYRRLNFYGGTCLHVVYALNRLSEDIDLDNTAGVGLDGLENDLLAYFQSVIGFKETAVKSQMGVGGIRRITLKFPLLYAVGLASQENEALHLKVEISSHPQAAVIQKTPVLTFGRSFVASHFSLETLMSGKMLACLERSFHRGRGGASIKGKDFYDLLWFMQKGVWPLEEKLKQESREAYTVPLAMLALQKKIALINTSDLREDLLPLFEQRSFIESWLEGFQENFARLVQGYL